MRRQGVALGLVVPAVLLSVSGCATKDWVREMLGTKDAEMNQRFAGVDQRVGEEAQRIDGIDSRVRGVETGVAETSQVAQGARDRAEVASAAAQGAQTRAETAHTRADAAYARADEVDGRLTRLWSNRHKRDLVETMQVHFGFDRADLSDAAQTVLTGLVRELQENPRLTVDLAGYADPKGPHDYNVALSQRRVEAVRRYLVERGIELPRIHSVGLGPVIDTALPDAKKRRVTVRLMVQAD